MIHIADYLWSLGSQRISLGYSNTLNFRDSLEYGNLGPKVSSVLYLSSLTASVLRRSEGFFYRLDSLVFSSSSSSTSSVQIRIGSSSYTVTVPVTAGQFTVNIPNTSVWTLRHQLDSIPYRGKISIFIDEISGSSISTVELQIDLSTGAASALSVSSSVSISAVGDENSGSAKIRSRTLDASSDDVDIGALSLVYSVNLIYIDASSTRFSVSCYREGNAALETYPIRFEYSGSSIDVNTISKDGHYVASYEFTSSTPASSSLRIIPYTSEYRTDFYSVVETSLLGFPGSSPDLSCTALARISGSSIIDFDLASAVEIEASSAIYAAKLLPSPQYVNKIIFKSVSGSISQELSASNFSVSSIDNSYLAFNLSQLRSIVLESSDSIESGESLALSGYLDFYAAGSSTEARSPLIAVYVRKPSLGRVSVISQNAVDSSGRVMTYLPLRGAQRVALRLKLPHVFVGTPSYTGHSLSVEMGNIISSGSSITFIEFSKDQSGKTDGVVMQCITSNNIPDRASVIATVSGSVDCLDSDGSAVRLSVTDEEVTLSSLPYSKPVISAVSVSKASGSATSATISLTVTTSDLRSIGITNNWSAKYQYYVISDPSQKSNISTIASNKSSGSSATISTGNVLNANNTYIFLIAVTDQISGESDRVTKLVTLPGALVIYDVAADGKSIAFGKYAEEGTEGLVDMGWPCRFKQGIDSITVSSGDNLNNCTVSGFYRGNTTSGAASNLPAGVQGDWGMFVMSAGITGSRGCFQILICSVSNATRIYRRYGDAQNSFTSWS